MDVAHVGMMRRECRWMEQARPCHRKYVWMQHSGSTGGTLRALRHGRNKCVWQSCCRKSAGARDAMAKLLAACNDVIILERVAMGKACCMAIHVQPRTPTRASPSDRANGRGGHATFRRFSVVVVAFNLRRPPGHPPLTASRGRGGASGHLGLNLERPPGTPP